jgi:hypothetical protein
LAVGNVSDAKGFVDGARLKVAEFPPVAASLTGMAIGLVGTSYKLIKIARFTFLFEFQPIELILVGVFHILEISCQIRGFQVKLHGLPIVHLDRVVANRDLLLGPVIIWVFVRIALIWIDYRVCSIVVDFHPIINLVLGVHTIISK